MDLNIQKMTNHPPSPVHMHNHQTFGYQHKYQAPVLDISSCTLLTVSQPHHVPASHPSPGDNNHSAVRKNTGTKQKWLHETQSSTYVPGLSTPSNLSRIESQFPPSSLCWTRPSSHHFPNLTSVYPVPDLHHLHSSIHMELIHSLHVSKPSLYSLIHFTHQLTFYSSYSKHNVIPNYVHS